jgi:CubicO group peptidase (beta-lactamase class C family)
MRTLRTLLPPLLAAALGALPAPSQEGAAPAPGSLDALLEPIRAEFDLPALGGAIVSSAGLRSLGAVGKRRVDRNVAVTSGDRWHLGSCTKAMTASWIALLVQRGELRWDLTVGEAFADLVRAERVHPDWTDVPLEWLLQHRGGAPAKLDEGGLWMRLWGHAGSPVEQRRTLVEGVLSRPPEVPPGSRFLYSNAGYAIAAAMAETALGEPWEARIRSDLFAPLSMSGAGFGAPGVPTEIAQPFGHHLRNGELQAIPLGPGDDNPSAIAPAGKVHATLSDWAAFAALHLAGARGGTELLLSPESFARLHGPQAGEHAMGWFVREADWAESRVLWHNGSNTMWYCEIALVPDRDLALLVVSNRGDGRVRQGVSKALVELYRHAR